MSKYEEFFNDKAFEEERPIIEYEEIEPEIDDDLCTCDFTDQSDCPIHNNQNNEEN